MATTEARIEELRLGLNNAEREWQLAGSAFRTARDRMDKAFAEYQNAQLSLNTYLEVALKAVNHGND